LTFLGYEIGVKRIVLGFLIGALAVAFGEWLNRLIKRKFFKGQDFLIIALTFILTYLPVKNHIFNYCFLYFPNLGVHTPILINKSLLSEIFGGFLVYIAPFISRWISRKRDRTILFQIIIVILILLIILD
jgi:AAA+ ATPase superfamily predicted ATPase